MSKFNDEYGGGSKCSSLGSCSLGVGTNTLFKTLFLCICCTQFSAGASK